MIVGLIFVGTVLGSVAGAGALLLGSSIWSAFQIYTAVGVLTVLGLAVSVALRPDPQNSVKQAESYALADPQRG